MFVFRLCSGFLVRWPLSPSFGLAGPNELLPVHQPPNAELLCRGRVLRCRAVCVGVYHTNGAAGRLLLPTGAARANVVRAFSRLVGQGDIYGLSASECCVYK